MHWLVLLIWSAAICGIYASELQNRIHFGNDDTIENYPYQVAVMGKTNFCGGSLIGPSIVLTAAHCVTKSGTYSVVAGSSHVGRAEQTIPVYRWARHPKFHNVSLDYDVAILHLLYPVTLNDRVKTIELQTVGISLPDGTEATVAGWGKTQNGDNAKVIQSIKLYKSPEADCAFRLYPRAITSRMTCYARFGDKAGICLGDSGGPLVVNDKQVGIVSFIRSKDDCGSPIYPVVFTRIEDPSIYQFIQECVKQINGYNYYSY